MGSGQGRLTSAILRIVQDDEDYMAHRLLLGTRRGIGPKTCYKIRLSVISNSLNFRRLFYEPLPKGLFKGRDLTAIEGARTILAKISDWKPTDSVGDRIEALAGVIETEQSAADAKELRDFAKEVPPETTLDEFRQYLTSGGDESRRSVLKAVHERLGLGDPTDPKSIGTVRIMTMHGAKGLTCNVVMIPGLEEEVLPGDRRRPYPGLVLEAARLLYVSITRARVACVCAFARKRLVNGVKEVHTASRFAKSLGGPFTPGASGFSPTDADEIMKLVSLVG